MRCINKRCKCTYECDVLYVSMLLLCSIRNNYCTLLRNIRREKTLGEMWADVIRTINNLLWTAWLWTRAPQMGTEPESVDAQKGTMKDIFARYLKKNKAQVCILLKSCAYVKRNFNLMPTLVQVSLENQHPRSKWLRYLCINIYLVIPASILFYLFPCPRYFIQ